MTSSDGLAGPPHRQRSIKDRLKDGLSSWQTKSRSVDQSLAAAFDVDVIGGLSRLAGSALGGSTESGRPGSPIGGGVRRSSGSGGSGGRLAEDTLAYTVQSSDTLTSLAARFDTTPSELVAINKLHSRLIFPGQVLQVPRKDGDGSGGGAGEEELPNVPLNVSIKSSSSQGNINEVGDGSAYPSPPADRPNEHAFLDSLRPPGSPRVKRPDGYQSPGSGGPVTAAGGRTPADVERDAALNEQYYARMDVDIDVEAERIRDRSAYEKFLKINVRHVTDGLGVVAGVLLVTPNTVMFDPNVSDPLVIEHGAEAYGVIAPVEFVVNAALYPDIAHMRLADSAGQPDQPNTDPIYFPTNCPLYRKYAILKEKAQRRQQQEMSPEAAAADLDPAAGILAIASDIQRRWSEGDDMGEREATASRPDDQPDNAPTAEPTKTDLGHVIRLQVKSEPLATIPDVVAPSTAKEEKSTSSIRVTSSIDKTPSAERDDELCISEELNVTDEDDKDEAFHSSGSGYEQTISDAMQEEPRARHYSAGASCMQANTGRSRTLHSSLYRQPRHTHVSEPSGRASSSSPAPISSSPESRGHRMLKRLSYPLVWMGESLSADSNSKENSPVLTADKDPNAESVFSKVFSRRLSTENSIKLDSRLMPNLFRGKDQPAAPAQPKMGYRSMVSVDDVPELFASLDKLIPKPAQPCDAPPLYLRLRMGKPLNRKGAMTTPIMSYGKKKMKPEYWFSIPRDKADMLVRFFLLWSPDVYGEPGDAESCAKRGFELITDDLEWEEPSPVRRLKPAKKGGKAGKRTADGNADDEDDDPLGVTAELAKESWEIVSLNEEVRRALYGVDRLSALDLDSYLPDLIGPTEVLTDEHRKQLAKHLPARVEGYPWTLVFSTSQNGFSLNSLYRKMVGIDSPILLIIEDTQGNVFGAVTSCEIRVSESFYGTGESFLFVMNPKLQVYSWTGDNTYFIQGNNESLAIGAGDGRFGLWLDGDLNQGRTQTCKTFGNDPLSPDEDFWVKTLECWAFM